MNIENMQRTITFLREEVDTGPRQFSMVDFFTVENGNCFACIAGWAAFLALDWPEDEVADLEDYDIEAYATEFLGLNDDEALSLFRGLWSDRPMAEIDLRSAIKHLEAMVDIHKAQVA